MMKKIVLKMAMLGGAVVLYNKLPNGVKSVVAGNLPVYSPSKETMNVHSSLYGKRVVFLGSSITYGAGSMGKSFVEYLQARDGVIPTKSAISGTTLAGLEPKAYTSRLRTDFDQHASYDVFVCQLSTNDDRDHKKLGEITPYTQKGQFDRNTTIGAIEDTLSYVRTNFGCPIIFYTCLRKTDEAYSELIKQLYALQAKWHFYILDLWDNSVMKESIKNNPSMMVDDAHPTQFGYKQLWTPVFEKELQDVLNLDK